MSIHQESFVKHILYLFRTWLLFAGLTFCGLKEIFRLNYITGQ